MTNTTATKCEGGCTDEPHECFCAHHHWCGCVNAYDCDCEGCAEWAELNTIDASEVAGLQRFATAMRPGETFVELCRWAQARGLTTIDEVAAARKLDEWFGVSKGESA